MQVKSIAECSKGSAMYAKIKSLSRDFFFLIITRVPSKHTVDYPEFTVSNFMEKFIGLQRVNVWEVFTEGFSSISSGSSQFAKVLFTGFKLKEG